jgi:hypothetical protein
MGALRAVKPVDLFRQPFHAVARDYYATGWSPLPLPPARKEKVPVGYTGWKATKKVTQKQVDNWLSSQKPKSNIAHQPTPDYIGIDVDLYKPSARTQWDAIVEEMGELPETWTSSARDDGSGIRHFRLPEEFQDLAWPGTVGEAIQFCHVGHRYPVMPPSVHPEGGNYLWYKPGAWPDGNGEVSEFPAFKELPELPAKWVEYFTKGRFAKHLPEKNLGSKSTATKKVAAWIAEHDGDPCAKMLRTYDEVLEQFDAAAAHDTMLEGFYRLACIAAEQHKGLAETAERLHEAFNLEVRREGRAGTVRGAAEAEEEWLRARDSGVKKVLARIDEGDFYGFECNCAALDAEGRPRPAFNVANYDIVSAAEQCWRALAATEATDWMGCYNEGGNLVQVTRHGKADLTVDSLRLPLASVTEWLRPGGDGPPQKANPPRDMLATLVDSSALRDNLPELRGVMRTPFFAKVDGKPTLINTNGYHPEVGILLQMDAEMEETVSKVDLQPEAAWVERSKELISDIFRDFPFVGSADRATAYAALLLPFVRDLVVGGTPLHLVEAPIAGTGKGLLTEAISLVACGALSSDAGFQRIAVTDDRNRNVEMVKEINARMKEDPRCLVLDNVNQKLDSGALASALTSETYQVRLLGASSTVNRANRALWMATANNLTASQEMRRRILVCRLDAGVERPAERGGFRHENLLQFVEERRPSLVWACLTLVANWVASGCPTDSNLKMGSFEGWIGVMSGLLGVNGIAGLLGNREEFTERSSDEGASLEALVLEWWAAHKSERMKARQLATLPTVVEMFGDDAKGVDMKIGRLLSAANGQVFGDLKLCRGALDGSSVYYLQPKGEAPVVKTRRARGRRRA